uniref:NADH-ubiquinone oxidoreductase chain 3 n=1 Tax=Patella vulgata TaxID=6465 RepID=A0A481MVL2_PATVU|nr:NADH dehydrogenase subunit 3 [Patella vulgata]
MISLILTSLLVFSLCIIMTLLGWAISARTIRSAEKMSPFECGFDPKGSARAPFSMRYFLLAIIFLIFDVEVVLLFPFLSQGLIPLHFQGTLSLFIFLMILLLGLVHEWNQGSLNWA